MGNTAYTYSELKELTDSLPRTKNAIENKRFVFGKHNSNLRFAYFANDLKNDTRFDKELEEILFEPLPPEQTYGLVYLNANNCRLQQLDLPNCPQLKTLSIFGNGLTKLSLSGVYPNLELIDLSKNKLTELGFTPEQVPNLKYLYLTANQLTDLSVWQSFFAAADNDFNIDKMETLTDPPQTVVKDGKDAVREHFSKIIREGEDYIFEVKMMLLGEGTAGKTSLKKRLLNPEKRLDASSNSTVKIEIDTWKPDFYFEGKQKQMRVNIWDLAGQEIYRGTHQMFFEDNTFFVYVINGLKGCTDEQHRYWLGTVEQLAETDSNLFVVGNIEGSQVPVFMEASWQNKFKFLRNYLTVDLNAPEVEIKELQRKLRVGIEDMKQFVQRVPKSRAELRKTLLGINKDWISISEYAKLANIEIGEELNKTSNYLSRLGVLKHYYNDRFLEDRVYLNLNRLLDNVYKVLNKRNEHEKEPIAKVKKGKLTETDIRAIWGNDAFYSDGKHLIHLMKKFGLMYEANDIGLYIVPTYLLESQADEWDYSIQSLQLVYEFPDRIPYGFMMQLIVALSDMIPSSDKVWSNKCHVSDGVNFAEISNLDRFIYVKIAGMEPKKLLGSIDRELKKLLADFKKMIITEKVPCLCNRCAEKAKTNEDIHFFEYPALLNLLNLSNLQENKGLAQCSKSGSMVSITKMLNAVELVDIKDIRENRNEKMANFFEKDGNSFVFNINQENHQEQKQAQEQKQKQEQTVDINITISVQIDHWIEKNGELKKAINTEGSIFKKAIGKPDREAILQQITDFEKAVEDAKNCKVENKPVSENTKYKVAKFIENLKDKDSKLNKNVALLRKGVGMLAKLAETYNQIAPNVGLLSVPPWIIEAAKENK